MNELEEKSRAHTGTTIWIALSYGGRAEIIQAVNQAIKNGTEVDEKSFEALLWTAGMPDPDMIIRTSGEERLSNFLSWQSAYSEFYFIEKHWPALTEADFKDILLQYETRQRRHGA
jgi:undecaprenyl diphosphate synthase